MNYPKIGEKVRILDVYGSINKDKDHYIGKVGTVENTFSNSGGYYLFDGEIVLEGCDYPVTKWEVVNSTWRELINQNNPVGQTIVYNPEG